MGRSLNQRIIYCQQCPRLRQHCREIAVQKRSAFQDQTYHGGPGPNFGHADARVLVVGLAPAAHGANRTGRMFTGDRSGEFLYRAMHESGFASQAIATDKSDGLELLDTMITAVVHCAPPKNKPTIGELENCLPFLTNTFEELANLAVVVCLGQIASHQVLKHYKQQGWIDKLSDYPFAHGACHVILGAPIILCSYHPSQQNTFTGRLTHQMLLNVFCHARKIVNKRP